MPAARALALAAIALGALAVGVAFYAFLRPHAAAFLPSNWHRPLAQGLPPSLLALTAGLPTFVHTLAMCLLTAAVPGWQRSAALQAICAAWCALEITFEAAQHAAIRPAMLAMLPADAGPSALFAPITNYLRSGSFDPLDVAAALLASSTAYAILVRLPSPPSSEAHHAQARSISD
jgi:hypothetical protein